MGRKRTPLPTTGDTSALRTADADLWGISRSRRRRADIASPHRGVALIGAEITDTAGACRAYEAVRLPGQVYTHVTAAALIGIPLPRDLDLLTPHISVQAPRSAPRRPGIIGHSVRHTDLVPVRVGDLPVSRPADTWCDLAMQLCEEDLVAAGDYLVSERIIEGERHPPLCTLEDLRDAARRHRGSRGTKRRDAALPKVRAGVASRPETHLRLALIEAGLPEPVIAHPVAVEGGLVLHPDLVYPAARLAIEYEGDGHRTDQGQWRLDLRRREMLEAAGWRVVRVTADDLYRHRGELVARIRRLLNAR
ncbi:endonuclease domain-containing protein [Microbacterium sp. RD1]|uniref:endonuclease domain-containing protein n=1 Tax=Microbacterium sp. RD1 TaxID=3457313 RepID=UPI003FA5DEA5